MHVCFLCDEYPPAPHGGIGTFTRTLARSLVAAGHSASAVGVYGGVRDMTRETDHGVQVIRLPHSRVPYTGLVVNARTLQRALADLDRERSIDVLEGQESALARLPEAFSAPRLIRMHGGHHFFSTELGDRPRFPRAWLERRSFARADALCAVSGYVAERTRELLRLGDVEIEILPNPVDADTFTPRRADLERADSILFVGSLCEKKGIRQLVQAMPAIAAAVPGVRLDVVGRDRLDPRTGQSFRAQLDELIPASLKDRVVFHGAVDNRALPELMATAAVCVYPSHMEACPVAWLEAMAMRKAIVASRTGPGPEILEHGVSGLLCDPFDPRSIADAVVALLRDAGLRVRLASAAFQRAQSFSLASVVPRNLRFYQTCIDRFRAADRERSVRVPATRPPETLVVVSHVVHYAHGGRLFAYAPYARELAVWCDLFPRVVVAAPLRTSRPPHDCEPIAAANIAVRPQPERGGTSILSKLALAASVPTLALTLARALRDADAVHVRCPGNLGLLGAALAPCFSNYLVAKYAGQWSPYAGEPLTSRLQRWLLRSSWWRGPVLVYGDVPGQPAHVVPFFTSALTGSQIDRARAVAASRQAIGAPLRVLFVGRLSRAKNVGVLVDAIAALRAQGHRVECTIVGEGPERDALEARARTMDGGDSLRIAGGMSLDGVLEYYERSDVLVLASETEGWPKAIAEAMAFGVVCIGSDRGLVPWMLGEGRGVVVPPGQVAPLVEALADVSRRPAAYDQMRVRAAAWGQRHSLDSFKDALADVLSTRWNLASTTKTGRVVNVSP